MRVNHTHGRIFRHLKAIAELAKVPAVPRCSALYQHLLGAASTSHSSHPIADRFRHAFGRLIPDSRRDSRARAGRETAVAGFSLVSITVARSM